MTKGAPEAWPVLERYDQDHLARIAMPLGGMGTGTVSLGGRGNLQDFEVVNRPAKGFTPVNTFFVLWARQPGQPAVARVLEHEIPPSAYAGAFGCPVPNHNYPRFRRAQFRAAYPLGQVALSDPAVPADVRLEAFNPMIPADADASGIPVAVLRFVVTNKTRQPLLATVCGSMENFIGRDGTAGASRQNVNQFRRSKGRGGVCGVFMRSRGLDIHAEQFGTMALATTATTGVTFRRAWANLNWGNHRLDFWDDLLADGRLDDRSPGGTDTPTASLAVSLTLPPRASRAVTFLYTWHFPNRKTWTPAKTSKSATPLTATRNSHPDTIGNYYCTQYADAWDVAQKTAPRLAQLEAATVRFVHAFCTSDLPQAVKEAALFNLSTLRTQTCFRTPDGKFFGWEGCADNAGSCFGSCTHVWNYEHATAFLYGELARGMRDTEFGHMTSKRGLVKRARFAPTQPRPGISARSG